MLNELLQSFIGTLPDGFGVVEYLLSFFLLLFLLRFACLVVLSIVKWAAGMK